MGCAVLPGCDFTTKSIIGINVHENGHSWCPDGCGVRFILAVQTGKSRNTKQIVHLVQDHLDNDCSVRHPGKSFNQLTVKEFINRAKELGYFKDKRWRDRTGPPALTEDEFKLVSSRQQPQYGPLYERGKNLKLWFRDRAYYDKDTGQAHRRKAEVDLTAQAGEGKEEETSHSFGDFPPSISSVDDITTRKRKAADNMTGTSSLRDVAPHLDMMHRGPLQTIEPNVDTAGSLLHLHKAEEERDRETSYSFGKENGKDGRRRKAKVDLESHIVDEEGMTGKAEEETMEEESIQETESTSDTLTGSSAGSHKRKASNASNPVPRSTFQRGTLQTIDPNVRYFGSKQARGPNAAKHRAVVGQCADIRQFWKPSR
jgi:hypothetical protein